VTRHGLDSKRFIAMNLAIGVYFFKINSNNFMLLKS